MVALAGVEGVALEPVRGVVAPPPLGAGGARAGAALGAPDPLVALRARAREVPALVRGWPRHVRALHARPLRHELAGGEEHRAPDAR